MSTLGMFGATAMNELMHYLQTYIPDLITILAPATIYTAHHKTNNIHAIKRADGSYFWGNITLVSSYIDDEWLVYIRITDIDDLHTAKEKIKEKEYNLRTLLDSRNTPVWMIDCNYRLLDFNKKFAESLESYFQKKIHRGMLLISEVQNNAYSALYKQRYDQTIAGEISIFRETHKIDGKPSLLEITMYPIRSSGEGIVVGVAVFSEDITEREENNRKILAQEQLISTINQNISEGIYRSNRNGEIIYANP